MIVIAGGGVTGLSAAHQLQSSGEKYMLFEKAATLGGLCRSIRSQGYTFDWSGHLFCPKEQWVGTWVEELLNGNVRRFHRESCVHLKGENIPFPLQAHLGALPPSDALKCLASFLLERAADMDQQERGTWPHWIRRSFGEALAKLFFFPYHNKLWGVALDELSAEGTEWSVPRPTVEEVVDGALGGRNPLMGYNADLSYPANGGIEEIPKAMARGLKELHKLSGLQRVFWKKKQVVVKGHGKLNYSKLISTIPLSALLGFLEPALDSEARLEFRPRAVSIWVLNVGINKSSASDYHWIYFPEKEFPFFRIGCYTAFGPHLAPPGHSSFYVEIPCHWVKGESRQQLVGRALRAMVQCGLLKSLKEVEIVLPLKIPVAYVIHDIARAAWLPRILALLESHGIRCAGRYGAWGYGTMEHAIIQGREAAKWALED